MQEWVWEARTRAGDARRGIMEAESEVAVQGRLKQQLLTPVKIRRKPRDINISFGSPVSEKELVVFVRQFGTMIDAGLPLVQSLDILSSQGDNKAFNRILRDVKQNVEEGATFSESLAKHPKVFDALFVNLVAAGEIGGILDTILNRLGAYIEKRVKLKRQIRSALVYPTSVLVIAAVVMTILLGWVIPGFQAMFRDFGAEENLPDLTVFVINLSEGFVKYFPLILLLLIGIAAGFIASYRNPRGKRFWHSVLLGAPVLGPVMRKVSVARFTRTLGTLLSSGVPILDALDIVSKTAGNVIIEEAIRTTSDKIREGRTMADPLMETRAFPAMVVQMIGVGEQTGELDRMLSKIADFYEEEVDVAVAGLTSLLEPIMMVVIGGMVGFMLVAMYLPVFQLAGNIGVQ